MLRKSYAAPGGPEPPENWTLRAAGNALSAAITLGSGNSLGPEAPAATLGANVAFGLGQARPSGTDGRWTSRGLGTAELSGLRLTAGHLYVLMPGREAKRWVGGIKVARLLWMIWHYVILSRSPHSSLL